MAAWIGSQETLGSNLILLFINYVALGKFVNLLELHFFCQMGIIPAWLFAGMIKLLYTILQTIVWIIVSSAFIILSEKKLEKKWFMIKYETNSASF